MITEKRHVREAEIPTLLSVLFSLFHSFWQVSLLSVALAFRFESVRLKESDGLLRRESQNSNVSSNTECDFFFNYKFNYKSESGMSRWGG